ncbi:MAG TPA: hypothetical protein VH833_08235 [Gemmatimonadales bacterium]
MSTATVNRTDLAQKARTFPVSSFRAVGLGATAVGLVLLLLNLRGHADRVWSAYHFNLLFWLGLAQAGVVFAASQKLAKGHWSGLVIRFAEASVAFLPVGVVLFLASLFGRGHIYSWIAEPRTDLGWWLTPFWFYVRNGALLTLLAWLSWRFVREDMAPDVAELAGGAPVEPNEAARGRINRDAALVVVGYAFGYSLLAFDLVMSLAHKWVSNLYGAFYFMGSFLAALMWLAVLSIRMRTRMGLDGLYSKKQQHDLAKLCFGLTVFWAYLMFSQFLVIWYGNLPEETYFIFYRLWGVWRPFGVAVFLMVFLIPFIGLLGEKPKKAPAWFLAMALVSLSGIWIERYLEIVPSINDGAGPALGLPELGALLFFGGLYALAVAWFAGRYPMISPRLAADTLEREHGH